ncbi:type II restriction endonuclease [Fundicoccus culcitae]|uniref:Type-2 restriction enzyme n=1 Tax=Fundicoccus culcitae TaxID=2969821 RepID=A0ABY5P475_9LACT|nr:type II restriction endonuclease [Fundicoccus culcitae]UUX33549.1 type II restriction endonuclease [Fundicoccus culcitae]
MLFNEYQSLDTLKKFDYFMSTLSKTNRTPEYYVNWEKVTRTMASQELSLNTLNYLVGKPNIKEEATALFESQPQLLKAIPLLIASRENNLDVLQIDDNNDIEIINLNFSTIDTNRLDEYTQFIEDTGLFSFLQNDLRKNLVDYVYGVEVGLDSNARKNRSGTMMEKIVDNYVTKTGKSLGFDAMTQATPSIIKSKWNIDIPVDKSNRRFDNAIYNNRTHICYLIETNYYGGGGSKLKAVAGEFSDLNSFLKQSNENIKFVWVTDGQGWHTARFPLYESFSKIDYIFNIEMLSNDFLDDLLKS